jgi:fatty acid-binding protein DegV
MEKNFFDRLSDSYEERHFKDSEIHIKNNTLYISPKLKLILGWSLFILCSLIAYLLLGNPFTEKKNKGITPEAKQAVLEKEAHEAVIFLTVSSLNQFRKSGRITPTVAALGNLIHIHPVLRTDGGKFDVYTNAHGLLKARSAMIRAITHARTTVFRDFTDDQLYVASADSYENERDTEKWKAYVQEQFPQLAYFHDPLPLSICGHTGADAIGIGMFAKE